MFKKGDRVTRGDWHAIGTIISTHEKHGQGYAEIDYGEWGNWKFRLTELKLIHRPAEPAPLFAVGDKVRHMQLTETGEGVVENIYGGDTFGVRWSSRHGFCTEPASDLGHLPEHVAVAASNDNAGLSWYEDGGFKLKADTFTIRTPITIQAGRFYRTRDGRKVGPMDSDDAPGYMWADVEGVTRSFKIAGGAHCDETDLDLISEWPASNTDIFDELEDWMADNPIEDKASTAGFTVPLCECDEEAAPSLDLLHAAREMVKTGVCTINEVRGVLGLPPVTQGHLLAA